MIHKETIGNELYVYCNGSLLYKRWLEQDYGMVMCRQPFTAKDTQAFAQSVVVGETVTTDRGLLDYAYNHLPPSHAIGTLPPFMEEWLQDMATGTKAEKPSQHSPTSLNP